MRAQCTNEKGLQQLPIAYSPGGKKQSASNMQFSLFVKILIVSLICFHIQIAETTFSDFEGAAISVPDDTLNWFQGMYLLEPVMSKGSTVDETHIKLYQKSYFSLQKAIKFFVTFKRIISALCLTIYEFVTKIYYFWYG
ncbi:uncharacterized protein LOC126190836 isoform X2 [Schistocerca cancellata]|uniref:uncharacterized protein LOC126190836 isoform X2 n=1 Tax=Schistocerca cancellata TaxID=274614 RepID=UPI00211842EB|nr:uncharacterized protein LOC126190836 isoform X2 [Schistocerca cancellata]